jgi:hypothetical protein
MCSACCLSRSASDGRDDDDDEDDDMTAAIQRGDTMDTLLSVTLRGKIYRTLVESCTVAESLWSMPSGSKPLDDSCRLPAVPPGSQFSLSVELI